MKPILPLALLLTAVVLGVGCGYTPQRDVPVGRTSVAWSDPQRHAWQDVKAPRPLQATLWFPAVSGSDQGEWAIDMFHFGWNAVDAKLAAGTWQRPLVLLSHGTGGASAQLSWLAESLVDEGFLVAAVNHHGNTAAEANYLPQGFMAWWERPRDLSALLDNLLADPRFGPHVDRERIAAAGFSLGGYSVLSLAGATTDVAAWRRYCDGHSASPSCRLPPEVAFDQAEIDRVTREDPELRASLARAGASTHDARIKAVFAMAPVQGPALDRASLQAISIPVHIVVGSEDDQALPDETARPVAAAIPRASLQVLPGVRHYTFLAECTLKGRFVLPALCGESSGVDRRRVHQEVARDALAFFRNSLSPSAPDAISQADGNAR